MAALTEPIVVLVTTATEGEAIHIAEVLVNERLAACVNFRPVQSIYRWQSEVCRDAEYQLMIKTDKALMTAVEAMVMQHHSYELPEIIALPIVAGSDEYLSWLGDQLTP